MQQQLIVAPETAAATASVAAASAEVIVVSETSAGTASRASASAKPTVNVETARAIRCSSSLNDIVEEEVPRRVLPWRNAREDAELVLRQAEESSIYIRGISPIICSVDCAPGRHEMFSRLSHGLRQARIHHGGHYSGIAYIGSTSCPRWRWEGGYSWRGDCHRAEFMPGHKHLYTHMIVLASFPDKQTAKAEAMAIQWAMPSGLLANRAADARGLCIRGCAYSFLYVCY